MREHRYKFYLSNQDDLEKGAVEFLCENEKVNPHRQAELIRRLISQGYCYKTMLDTLNDGEDKTAQFCSDGAHNKEGHLLLLRLNPGDILSGAGVWQYILEAPNGRTRRERLRVLLLYGFQLELVQSSSKSELLRQLQIEENRSMNFDDIVEPPVVETPQVKVKTQAQSSLGKLM